MRQEIPERKPWSIVARRRIAPKGAPVMTGNTIDPERRRALVAQAAYFCAEHRSFEPGHEVEDWLAAERQVDAALGRVNISNTHSGASR